jgi:hypothetical protein
MRQGALQPKNYGCATNLWVMRNPPLEKGDKGGFLIENCLLLQKSPLTPLWQRGVIHSLPTNLSHTQTAMDRHSLLALFFR